MNSKLPKPYHAHNSKTITFDKGDRRADLIGEKREFDIFIIDENFVNERNVNLDRIEIIIETKPLNSKLDGIDQAEDAFTAFPFLKETFATSFGNSLYHRSRNEPQESIKISKKQLKDIIEEVSGHIVTRIKRIAKPVSNVPMIDEKKVILVLQDCMERIQSQMTELPDESSTEMTARTLVMWQINDTDHDVSKLQYNVKRAASYIIIDQILFYDLLQRHNTKYNLPPMKKIDETDSPALLYYRYIKRVIKITGDYRPIFEIDVLSLLPESVPVVNAINDCITKIKGLNLDVGNTDFLGKIFHQMIPSEIRKGIAAYYTGSAPARLLASLALDRCDMKVCDLACGSGTLLVESYHVLRDLYHKEHPEMSDDEIHKQILENQIYGNDITLFASHLTSMNLASQHLDGEVTRINVTSADGLKINPNGKPVHMLVDLFHLTKEDYETRSEKAVEMKVDENDGIVFPYVDCVIMNPPFSRQTDMSEEILSRLESVSKEWFPDKKECEKYIDAKMGLHGYFIIHADHFLKKGGVIAMVLPTSTFTTDYTEKILTYLKQKKYGIDYAFEILSKRSAFSEDCTFKEYMVIFRKGSLSDNGKTRLVSIKKEIDMGDVIGIISDVENPLVIKKTVSTMELYGSSNWNAIFVGRNEAVANLSLSPKMEKYNGNSSDIKISRGYDGTYSDFLMLPNDEWQIIRLNSESFRLDHITVSEGDAHRFCVISSDFLVPAIRNSEGLDGMVSQPDCWVLNLPPELPSSTIDFQRKYIHWAEDAIEGKWERARKDGHKRVDICKRSEKKDGKYVKIPWFSHAWMNRCQDVNAQILVTYKYTYSSRKCYGVFVAHPISVNHNFRYLKHVDPTFYVSYMSSGIYFHTLFGLHRIVHKDYAQVEVGDLQEMMFPKYSKFDDVTKTDLITKWQSLADVKDLPFLPQQFGADEIVKGKTVKGVKQPDTIKHYESLPERVALDNAWLKALGIPDGEIEETRKALYAWLIDYMELR